MRNVKRQLTVRKIKRGVRFSLVEASSPSPDSNSKMAGIPAMSGFISAVSDTS